jgi:hypothetical protein
MKQTICATILVLIVVGCSPVKRAERKQEKTWDAFVVNPTLISRAVPLVAALYPCINEIVRSDTNTIYILDSFAVEKRIPFAVTRDIDTTVGYVKVHVDSLGVTVQYLGKIKTITKTVIQTLRDDKEINRLTDSLNKYKVKEAAHLGQLKQIQEDNAGLKKDITKGNFRFYGLISLIVAILGITTYLKLKTKIPLIP